MEPATLGSTISTVSGLDLFNSIRWDTSQPDTLVDGLDALLHGSATPLRRGDIIEVQGVTASGKTQLLVRIAVNALLPRRAHVRLERDVVQIVVGGKEEQVVWIDCTAREFDIDRIVRILRAHFVSVINQYRRPKGIGPPTDQELDSLVEECMTRFYVFSPTSTLQLASTIQTLPEWHVSTGGDELAYILIDGMTEFAWLDQYDREVERNTKKTLQTVPPLRLFSAALARLRHVLAPLVFITQWVLRPSQPVATPSQQNLPFYRHHFTPPLYPSLTSTVPLEPDNPLAPIYYPSSSSAVFPINFHLTLHPAPKPVFRKGISLGMVLKEGVRTDRAKERQTEGIVCVLREAGGNEVGSWEMTITATDIIA
ncbi:uncharacterized protein JCM15063_005956 [Sporobolomyces koalae]|uniref:uncharacterized protein n=1 Tax=Sporobolomyces koalae TaxID=500713 RepID=UPI00316C1325